MGFRRSLLLAIWSLLLAALPAHAEKRVGLVIGNDLYSRLAASEQLRNAVNDASAMRKTLEALGFEVIYGENLDYAGMVDKMSIFERRLEEGDTAFFFYSGHGAVLKGANYMLPSDVPRPESLGEAEESRIARLSISEADVIEVVRSRARARVAVVVLDACRDTPLKLPGGRSFVGGKGLAPPPQAEGVVSIYSAGVGQIALDRLSDADKEKNSVFTRVFLQNLATPGLGLTAAAKATKWQVTKLARSIGREQTPGVYSQILGEREGEDEIYLNGRPAANGHSADTAADFAAAKRSGTLAGWKGFLDGHPIGPLADLAREEQEKLARLQFAGVPPVAPVVPHPSGPCGGVTLASLGTRSPSPLSANEECALAAKAEFQECESCPKMVVVPAGSFTMGSPKGEEGRYGNEGPQHDVTMSRPFAVGKFHVTVDEFNAFVSATGYDAGSSCWYFDGREAKEEKGRTWRAPGYSQTRTHPVACVSWTDALAYAAWVSQRTGKTYRLLSESEWEYSARGRTSPGTYPRFFFGDAEASMCKYGNGLDATATMNIPWAKQYSTFSCSDGAPYTSSVGSYSGNNFGLYDMHGNLWQWVQDCYHENYSGAPADGSTWTSGDCSRRVLRGGSWLLDPRDLRDANRSGFSPINQYDGAGLRLARTLNN